MVDASEKVNFGMQFFCVLGHEGIKGNKQVDRLAETTVISDGRAMDYADVLHAL
jgi:ribonuclease HI